MSSLAAIGHAVPLSTAVAVILAAATVLSAARLLRRHRNAPTGQRAHRARVALLVLAQPLCAALLHAALFPPAVAGRSSDLVVVTGGATAGQFRGEGLDGVPRVALPEAPSRVGAARVPDLATALRRHPGVHRVLVVGAGLEPRDRDAAQGLALEFRPAPLPRGLVELTAPARVAVGDRFAVAGRAEGVAGGAVELLDPAGRRVDRSVLAADGRFTTTGTTRVPGAASYRLRLRDARATTVEELELPLQVAADAPPRVLLLAGAPNPELKYLRRWARDAGVALHTQIAAGGGLQLGDPPVALDEAGLARFDLVVLDERAWSALGDARRATLVEAVHAGVGLLLRVTSALPDADRGRLAALGFEVDSGRGSTSFRLASRRLDDATVDEVPTLTRRALGVVARDAVPLLQDAAGAPVAVWRAWGRGRVALWTPTDSYRLVLAGRDDLHGEVWSRAFATLARARPSTVPELAGDAWVGERVTLCGLAEDARVVSRGGVETTLLTDPRAGARGCAGYWPRESGWHRLQSGDDERHFHVRGRDAAHALRAAALREATSRLGAGATAPGQAAAARPQRPGPRWPWWLAWLLASTALWGFERYGLISSRAK